MAGFFDTLFGGGAEKEAADKDRAALASYQQQGLGALGQSYTTGTDALNKAIGGYTPLANLGATYGSGAQTLMSALGVNGPEGTAAAQSAFNAGPGYTWQRDQTLDALNRRAGMGNMGQSGNADIAAMNYASGLANQSYQQWLDNLMKTGGMGITATGTAAQGQGSGYTNFANLAQTYGQNQTGLYQNVAQGNIGANNLQAAGEAAGGKNLLNFGVNLASMAMGMPPGLGSSLSSGASNAFGSLMGNTWQQNNPGAFGSQYFGPVAPGS